MRRERDQQLRLGLARRARRDPRAPPRGARASAGVGVRADGRETRASMRAQRRRSRRGRQRSRPKASVSMRGRLGAWRSRGVAASAIRRAGQGKRSHFTCRAAARQAHGSAHMHRQRSRSATRHARAVATWRRPRTSRPLRLAAGRRRSRSRAIVEIAMKRRARSHCPAVAALRPCWPRCRSPRSRSSWASSTATRHFPRFSSRTRRAWSSRVDEVNAAGGVLGRPLEIVSRDDNGNPGDAVRVAEELAVARKGRSC